MRDFLHAADFFAAQSTGAQVCLDVPVSRRLQRPARYSSRLSITTACICFFPYTM